MLPLSRRRSAGPQGAAQGREGGGGWWVLFNKMMPNASLGIVESI